MTFDDALRDVAIPGVVGLIMFVVGLNLTVTNFRRVAKYPKAVIVATLGQLILLPLIAVLLIFLFKPPPHIAAGLILLAASPAGGLSNFYTYLGHGNTALSVTLTAISNLLCFFTLPIIAAPGFAWLLDYQVSVEMPLLRTIRQLLIMLLVPIVSGMLIRYSLPILAERWRRPLGRLSLFALAALVVTILFGNQGDPQPDGTQIVKAAVPFYLLAMVAGWATGRIAGLPVEDCFTLTLEYPARNLGITAVVGVMVLGRTDFILFATILFLVQTPILLSIVGVRYLRIRKQKSEFAGEEA